MFKIFVIIIIAVGIFFGILPVVTPSKKRFYRQLHSILCNCRLLNTVRQPFFTFYLTSKTNLARSDTKNLAKPKY